MRVTPVLRHLQGSSTQHGDAKLIVIFQTLADCPKPQSATIYDRCKGGRRQPIFRPINADRLARHSD
jgi:hypothetical protein